MKIRWQLACLADDIRRFRRRLHDWWNGYGEHCYDTGQIQIISLELAERPWPKDACKTDPPCEPEDNWQCGYHGPDWDPEQAKFRAENPRLFWPNAKYWDRAWADFNLKLYASIAWDTADANKTRRECGLPPRPIAPSPSPFPQLTAA